MGRPTSPPTPVAFYIRRRNRPFAAPRRPGHVPLGSWRTAGISIPDIRDDADHSDFAIHADGAAHGRSYSGIAIHADAHFATACNFHAYIDLIDGLYGIEETDLNKHPSSAHAYANGNTDSPIASYEYDSSHKSPEFAAVVAPGRGIRQRVGNLPVGSEQWFVSCGPGTRIALLAAREKSPAGRYPSERPYQGHQNHPVDRQLSRLTCG